MAMNKVTGMSTDDFSTVGIVKDQPVDERHRAAINVANRVLTGVIAHDELFDFLDALGLTKDEDILAARERVAKRNQLTLNRT